MIETCVIDASVGIKLFIEEEGSDAVDRLFARLGEEPSPRYFVPDIFFAECANILWKYVRHYGYPAENARQDEKDLQALDLYTVSAADVLSSALNLALGFDVAVYDACYTALAAQLQVPLITADEALVRKMAGSNVQFITLGDLPNI